MQVQVRKPRARDAQRSEQVEHALAPVGAAHEEQPARHGRRRGKFRGPNDRVGQHRHARIGHDAEQEVAPGVRQRQHPGAGAQGVANPALPPAGRSGVELLEFRPVQMEHRGHTENPGQRQQDGLARKAAVARHLGMQHLHLPAQQCHQQLHQGEQEGADPGAFSVAHQVAHALPRQPALLRVDRHHGGNAPLAGGVGADHPGLSAFHAVTGLTTSCSRPACACHWPLAGCRPLDQFDVEEAAPAFQLSIEHEGALRLAQGAVARHHGNAHGAGLLLLHLVETHEVPRQFVDDDGQARDAPALACADWWFIELFAFSAVGIYRIQSKCSFSFGLTEVRVIASSAEVKASAASHVGVTEFRVIAISTEVKVPRSVPELNPPKRPWYVPELKRPDLCQS